MQALSRASRDSGEIRTGACIAAEGTPWRQRGDGRAHGTAETLGRNGREVGAGVPHEQREMPDWVAVAYLPSYKVRRTLHRWSIEVPRAITAESATNNAQLLHGGRRTGADCAGTTAGTGGSPCANGAETKPRG